VLSTFIHRIQQTFKSHSEQQGIYAPILGIKDIHELQNRAESYLHGSSHPHEVEHRQHGDARSVYRGHGLDYEESRPYEPGDEMRFVNWRLSARTGKMYMKVFREERRPSMFILMDKRASMRFGSHTRLKVTQAARLSCLLACIAIEKNIPVAGVLLDEETEWLPECQGETAIYSFIQSIAMPCPPLDNESSVSLQHTLKVALNFLTPGSVVYLVSDFQDLDDGFTSSLLELSSKHSVTAVNIFDQHEMRLPAIGNINLYDPATGTEHNLDTDSYQLRHTYEELASDHFKKIMNIFTAAGIQYHALGSDVEDIEQVVSLP